MFSGVISSVRSMDNEMVGLNKNGLDLYLSKSGKMQNQLKTLFPGLKGGVMDYRYAINELGDKLQKNQDIMLTSSAEQKRLNTLAKKQISLGRDNVGAMKEGLETLNESKRKRIEAINAQIENVTLIQQEEEKKSEITKLEAGEEYTYV